MNSLCFLFCSNEALQNVGMGRNASEMENQVFQKVQTQEEYRAMVAKIVMHMQSKWNIRNASSFREFTSNFALILI